MKLDNQRRLLIPTNLVRSTGIDNSQKIYLNISDNKLTLYNLSPKYQHWEYSDIVKMDEKGRVFLHKYILEEINPNGLSIFFQIAAIDDRIIIRWKNKEDFK